MLPDQMTVSIPWQCKWCNRRLGDIYGTAVHIAVANRDVWIVGGTVMQKCSCGQTSIVSFTAPDSRVMVAPQSTQGV